MTNKSKKILTEISAAELLDKISILEIKLDKINDKEIIKILNDLGFEISKKKQELQLTIPTWRPDITQPIDIVEEIVRIKGYNNIKTLEPEKTRIKDTLNKQQKLFHFLQRSVASKGYYETVTWSFTDSKINQLFKENFDKLFVSTVL